MSDATRQTVKRLAALAKVFAPSPPDQDGSLGEQLTDVYIAALEWSAARKAANIGWMTPEKLARLLEAEAKLQAEVDK